MSKTLCIVFYGLFRSMKADTSYCSEDVQLKIFKALTVISSKLNMIQKTANSILRIHHVIDEPMLDPNLFNTSKISMNLPIKDETELEKMENWLRESTENPIMLSNELSFLGGTNLKDVTRKILYKTLSNEIGSLFSWDGAKGKRQFKKQKLANVIIRAVRLNVVSASSTESDIIDVIKHWLVRSKERMERGMMKLK
nr:uncharacterized protein LOC111502599 [Leptinotarsa decemlineata]